MTTGTVAYFITGPEHKPEYVCGDCASPDDSAVLPADADEFDEGLVCAGCGTELQSPAE